MWLDVFLWIIIASLVTAAVWRKEAARRTIANCRSLGLPGTVEQVERGYLLGGAFAILLGAVLIIDYLS